MFQLVARFRKHRKYRPDRLIFAGLDDSGCIDGLDSCDDAELAVGGCDAGRFGIFALLGLGNFSEVCSAAQFRHHAFFGCRRRRHGKADSVE